MLVVGEVQGLQPRRGECGGRVTCCWHEVWQQRVPAEHRPLISPAGNSDRRSVEGENPLWVVVLLTAWAHPPTLWRAGSEFWAMGNLELAGHRWLFRQSGCRAR